MLMNTSRYIFVVILLLCTPVLASADGADGESYFEPYSTSMKKISAPLRHTRGLNAKVIAVVRKGDNVEVMSESGGWARVFVPAVNLRGFLPSRDLVETRQRERKLRLKANLFECRTRGCPIIMKLPKGTLLEVLDYKSSGWAHVWAYHAEKEGWVKARRIR